MSNFITFTKADHSDHLSFKEKYTLAGWKPRKVNQLYTAESQTALFNELFIPFTIGNHTKNKYFSRNHLTPHADFKEVKHRDLTYFFHNCFPGSNYFLFLLCVSFFSLFIIFNFENSIFFHFLHVSLHGIDRNANNECSSKKNYIKKFFIFIQTKNNPMQLKFSELE